ncbi:hypothetical protein GS534_24490 [Rhodococcus hoagii]|nr:hypothetical protein [Prescottella equi]NKS33189.1 hypothetical protein [Prescottella equi]
MENNRFRPKQVDHISTTWEIAYKDDLVLVYGSRAQAHEASYLLQKGGVIPIRGLKQLKKLRPEERHG